MVCIGGGSPGGGPATTPGGAAAGGCPGGGVATATAAALSGVPHAWQNALPSGFWAPQRAQVSAIYARLDAGVAASLRGRRPRFTEVGAAVSAMPQLGQKPDATICMWQLGQSVSAKPMCAASSISAKWRRYRM